MSQPRRPPSTSASPRRRQHPPPPFWRRLLAVGSMTLAAGYACSIIPWGPLFPGLPEMFQTILPYVTLISAAIMGLGVLICVLGRSGHHGGEDLNASAPTAIARIAVAAEMKIPVERVQVTIRRSLLRRRLATVRIRLRPRGHTTEDPTAALAVKLTPLLGQLKKAAWDPIHSEGWLVPGTPEPGNEEEIPEAATEPVGRAVQIIEPLVKSTKTEVTARSDDGAVTEFFVRYPTNLRLANPELQHDLQERVNKMMPESPHGHGWGAQFQLQQDRIRVYERAPIPTRVLHPLIDYQEFFGADKRILPCATGADGVITGWDISPDTQKPHGLLVGPTGGGKTNTITTLVVGAARQGCTSGDIEMWGLDPKQIELMGLEGFPGVTRLAYTAERMAELIDAAHQEMHHRYTLIRKKQVHPLELPALVLILDELLVLIGMLTYWWKNVIGGKGTCPRLNQIHELLAMARAAAIYVLEGIQRPDAKVIPDGARDNLRFRGSLGALSREGAGMVWNNQHIGVTDTGIRGRGMATGLDGQPMEAQFWLTPSMELHPMYRNRMPQEHRDLADALRPEPYTPRSLTVDDLWLPPSAERQRASGVEAEMGDVQDVVRAKHLEIGDRIKLEDDSGRMSPAVVEDVNHDEHRGTVLLDLLWEGGSAEQKDLQEDEELWLLGKVAGVPA